MIIVDGKKYSTKDWRLWHPGGSMIEVPEEGSDCTALFNSYHPPKMMKTKEPFYSDLKERVHALGINLRESPIMYVKAVCILYMCVISWFMSFYGGYISWAPVMGFFKAMVGVNIQHDANHGAFSSDPQVNEYVGYTLDLFGASSYIWKQTHVNGHHVHTNHIRDPDIRTSDPDVRRVAPWDTVRWYHAYQHVYLPFLYTLLSIKSCTVDDFVALYTGKVGNITLRPMSTMDAHIFWMCKFFFVLVHVCIPMYTVGVQLYCIIMLVSELTTGLVLSHLFQVAHVTHKAAFHTSAHRVDDWAQKQVASSCDFAPGSLFWTHVSGGLNHQVVHHLFPGVNHCHYPRLWKIVKETCKKHDITYNYYDTFLEALQSHYSI